MLGVKRLASTGSSSTCPCKGPGSTRTRMRVAAPTRESATYNCPCANTGCGRYKPQPAAHRCKS